MVQEVLSELYCSIGSWVSFRGMLSFSKRQCIEMLSVVGCSPMLVLIAEERVIASHVQLENVSICPRRRGVAWVGSRLLPAM